MKKIIIIILLATNIIIAQNVGVNSTGTNAHPSAILDVDATPSNNKGFLMPRLTTSERIAILAPADGLMVYDKNLGGIYCYSTLDNKWDCAQTPAGTVQYFANTTAPRGYLECNGQSVSSTQYPELFTAIGYTYGGAGANFNVPDLRGEFVRSWDNGRGIDAARVVGSFQKGSILTADINSDNDVFTCAGSAADLGYDPINGVLYNNTSLHYITSGNVLSGGLVNPAFTGNGISRPRNIALMPCIKF